MPISFFSCQVSDTQRFPHPYSSETSTLGDGGGTGDTGATYGTGSETVDPKGKEAILLLP